MRRVIKSFSTNIYLQFMLAKGLRTHSVDDYGGYILSYIKIVYKHRNIPV